MAKDPVLPLYYNDIDSATRDWTDEEFGAYVRLLIYQWDKGGLPKDFQRLTRIATSLPTTWDFLKKKFDQVDGVLKNRVMEEIREKRTQHKLKQLENIKKRYQNSTNIPTKNLPLEIENEKEIENINENEIGKTIEFIKITCQWDLSPEKVKDYWKAFMIQNKGPGKRSDKIKHFRAWLKIQKPSNGTYIKPTSGKSAGAHELSEQLAAKLAARGSSNIEG
jgi:uncharacterized protein YdaU (DUF1376 family)